ncbi:hypothetical protein D3C75_543300 [compost metagenome]
MKLYARASSNLHEATKWEMSEESGRKSFRTVHRVCQDFCVNSFHAIPPRGDFAILAYVVTDAFGKEYRELKEDLSQFCTRPVHLRVTSIVAR